MPEFKIQHITKYIYEGLVRDSANQIILFPIVDIYQDVQKHDLKITGNPLVDTHVDYYGNEVGDFTYVEPHNQMVINSEVIVTTHPRPLPDDSQPVEKQWSDLASIQHIVPYIDFLIHEYFDGINELRAVVEAEKRGDETPFQTTLRFCDYIYKNFEYIKGVTTVETTVDEIWKLKAGVCQDFAHMLMVILRMLHIPSRYVSGYICPNRDGMRGEGATHAWAEVYLPDYGWLGIDPTNNCIANDTHVRLAVGRSFRDCSPAKGVYKGASAHKLKVNVTVEYHDGKHEEVIPDLQETDYFAINSSNELVKNSYQRYKELLLQQQQQQQQ